MKESNINPQAVKELSDQIVTKDIKSSVTLGTKVQSYSQLVKAGNVVSISLILSSVSEGDVLVSNLGTYSPVYKCIGCVYKASDGRIVSGSVWAETNGKLTYYGDTYNAICYCSITYITE